MSDDDTYEIPLQDQRVFGAGIKRQRVNFVPSSSSATTLARPVVKSMSDIYNHLLPPQETFDTGDKKQPGSAATAESAVSSRGCSIIPHASKLCGTCRLPLPADDDLRAPTTGRSDSMVSSMPKYRPHEASLAHQVCLEHSHPPSHLDRNRKGLAYLSAYGWDVDGRQGLGSEGQGIKLPIKTKPKDDKLGIGAILPKPGEIKKKVKVQKLNAGEVRKMYETDKRRRERLQELFYRNDDVERYLGGSS